MNPVRARLVDRPEDWPWSSYRATVGLEPTPAFLAVDSTLRLFGDDGDPQVQQQRFVRLATSMPVDHATVDRIRSTARILGTAEFRQQVHASASSPSANAVLAIANTQQAAKSGSLTRNSGPRRQV